MIKGYRHNQDEPFDSNSLRILDVTYDHAMLLGAEIGPKVRIYIKDQKTVWVLSRYGEFIGAVLIS